MSDYNPPFHVTNQITSLIAQISEQIGRITVLQKGTISPHLRRIDAFEHFFECF